MQDNYDQLEKLMKTMADHREDRQKKPELAEKHQQAFKQACDEIFDSEHGYVFLKTLVDFMGIQGYNNNMNGANLVAEKAYRNLYYGLIRPHLPKNVIRKVEG